MKQPQRTLLMQGHSRLNVPYPKRLVQRVIQILQCFLNLLQLSISDPKIKKGSNPKLSQHCQHPKHTRLYSTLDAVFLHYRCSTSLTKQYGKIYFHFPRFSLFLSEIDLKIHITTSDQCNTVGRQEMI